MKASIKILSLLFISFIAFTSCSKDDDPADNDLFIGQYDGTISFLNIEDEESVPERSGSVTVTKVGNNYTFNFSDGIPAINNIEMQKGDNNTLVMEDNEIGVIRITASNLTIGYSKDGMAWKANCSR